MKTLLAIILATVAFSAAADVVTVCDEDGNCEQVIVFPPMNPQPL